MQNARAIMTLAHRLARANIAGGVKYAILLKAALKRAHKIFKMASEGSKFAADWVNTLMSAPENFIKNGIASTVLNLSDKYRIVTKVEQVCSEFTKVEYYTLKMKVESKYCGMWNTRAEVVAYPDIKCSIEQAPERVEQKFSIEELMWHFSN